MSPLDPFYPVVDSAAWIARILPAGVKLVQLRIKDRAAPDLRDQVRRARDLCRAAGARLVLNDHWRLAIDEGIDFIHLGQEDLDGADVPALRRAGTSIGVSTHTHGELDRALSINPAYVALGPIFPTRLKAMPWIPQGIERVATWRRVIGDLPLVAIGGITVERAGDCLGAGATSVAVVTDIATSPDPARRCQDWISQTRPERRSRG